MYKIFLHYGDFPCARPQLRIQKVDIVLVVVGGVVLALGAMFWAYRSSRDLKTTLATGAIVAYAAAMIALQVAIEY